MPRYFFDIEDVVATADHEGVVLPALEAVPPTAMRTLLDVARDEILAKNGREIAVTARDGAGTPIYRALLSVRTGWLIEDAQRS